MQRIRNSLSAKAFLWVMTALTVCSLLIYCVIMLILPKQYMVISNSHTSENIDRLVKQMDGVSLTIARGDLYDFCIENHVTAMLTAGEVTYTFGDPTKKQEEDNVYTISVILKLSDVNEACVLTVIASTTTAVEITGTFISLLPIIAVLILLVSAFSAWLCSRVIVAPVLEISSISKRMARMDMTWKCKVNRTDELGVLMDSLNTLSEHLTEAMGKLEAANEQLRMDVLASKMMERQRRDFFAAASHELKTPITILKGQLESMVYGIGDYKNHEKYLPNALVTIENMEQLIREILSISKMESGIPAESFTTESLTNLVSECVNDLSTIAKQKSIIVRISQENDMSLRVYKPLFKKAISNIISNAVRYSPIGSVVSIAWTKQELTIENTGVTIQEKDLSSLFTPFYRVDPSRNRKSGGSGLGLYIVKTIMDLHDFDCEITNQENTVRVSIHWKNNESKSKLNQV